MKLHQVKPILVSLKEANVKSAVFCTMKYVNHYLVLCGPTGVATAWSSLKAAEISWKRNYTRLAATYNIMALEQHFNFYQPRLHVVTDIETFETRICPEPREVVNAEYIVGNCLGITCNNQEAEKFHQTGTKIKINFVIVDRLARTPRA